MKILFIFTFCLIRDGTDAVTTVTGYRGRSVQIKCPYGPGYEGYKKYLCRGKCSSWEDVAVHSAYGAKDTRFSLDDNTTANVFTVTITDLTPEDKNTHWCVIERTGYDIYTKLLLLVKTAVPAISTVSPATHTTHTTHTTSTYTTSPSVVAESTHSTSDTLGLVEYIMISAGAMLFIVAVIIAIYCKINHGGSGTVIQSSIETNVDDENDRNVRPHQAREKGSLPKSGYKNLDPTKNQSEPVYQNQTFTENQSDLI